MLFDMCVHKTTGRIGSIVRASSIAWAGKDVTDFHHMEMSIDPESEDFQVELLPNVWRWASEIDVDLVVTK